MYNKGKRYIKDQDIAPFIDSINTNISSTQINSMLSSFYKFLIESMNFNIKKLKMLLVLDTNQVLEAIYYTAKNARKSFLEILIDHPFLNIIAPPKLFDEVKEHLNKFVNLKKNITLSKLQSIWNRIKNKIPKIEPSTYEYKLIDSVRDKEDESFISLFMDTNATGILTKDKDIIEHPFTITSTAGKVINFTITFNKGLISFTFKNAIDISLDVILKIIVKFLFKFIHEGQKIVNDFVNLLSNFAQNNIKKIQLSHMAFMAVSLSPLIVLYLMDKDFSKSVNDVLFNISQNLKSFIDQILNILKDVKENLLPILYIVLSLIVNGRVFYKYLEKKITDLISILKGLDMIEHKKLNIQNNVLYYIPNKRIENRY